MVDFDIEFEEQILAQCLADDTYMKSAARLLNEHHFSSRQHSWVWSVIRDSWNKNRERLTPKLLVSRAKREYTKEDDQKLVLELGLKLFKIRPQSPKTTLEELQEFVKFVNLQAAMESSLKDMEGGKLDKAYDTMRRVAVTDFRPKAYKTINWMEEFNDRMEAAKQRRDHPEKHVVIPTGIKRLDNIIDGIRIGEVGLVIATTGRGKSVMLNHLGWHSIIREFGVLHFSLEMPAEQVAMRYDSRFTGVMHKKFKQYGFSKEDMQVIVTKVKKNKDRLMKKLKIISVPVRRCDINVIRGALDEAREEMDIHAVLVDSGDHLKSIRRYDQYRLEQADVYWDLKTLAEEEQVGVWSSTHAGKEWEDKVIYRTGAGAESYDKERIADIVVTLNTPAKRSRSSNVVVAEGEAPTSDVSQIQTPVEVGDILELYLAKYRDGESRIKIPLSTEFQRMLIKEAESEAKQ